MATAVCSEAGRRGNQLRHEFTLTGKPTQANVTVSSLGYNVLRCNGAPVSNHLLEPGRSNSERVFFSTFDLLPCLKTGLNALGVTLGNGWYTSDGNQPGAVQSPPSLWLEALITLRDGEQVRIVSDIQTWKSSTGDVIYDSVYQGETQDLRLRTLGWDSPGYNDTAWPAAVLGFDVDGVLEMTEQTRAPVVELAALKAEKMWR